MLKKLRLGLAIVLDVRFTSPDAERIVLNVFVLYGPNRS
jgi:hypothetical protein